VAVVTAGVAAVGNDALPGVPRAVRHRKRIHVGAKRNRGAGAISLNKGYDAARHHQVVAGDAPFAKLRCNHAAGAGGVEAELRMFVKVLADAGEFVAPGEDLFRDAVGIGKLGQDFIHFFNRNLRNFIIPLLQKRTICSLCHASLR